MKKKQIIATVVACVLVVATGITGYMYTNGKLSERDSKEEYLAVIRISGTIGDVSYNIYGEETTLSATSIVKFLDKIADDEKNKGIFLVINSPGGTVYDSDKIYQGLMEYKEKTGRPIGAACLSQMCSGAYYIACAADEIYAERTADVGSIGVYIQSVDISELCEKLGIDVDYIRSSENKAMGNMYNKKTEEQIAIYQGIIDECYERFLDIVQNARGYERDTLRAIADGRVYTATQALENGLIDGIGEYDDMLSEFKDKLGVSKTKSPYVASQDIISSILGKIKEMIPVSEASLINEFENSRDGEAMYYAG